MEDTLDSNSARSHRIQQQRTNSTFSISLAHLMSFRLSSLLPPLSLPCISTLSWHGSLFSPRICIKLYVDRTTQNTPTQSHQHLSAFTFAFNLRRPTLLRPFLLYFFSGLLDFLSPLLLIPTLSSFLLAFRFLLAAHS